MTKLRRVTGWIQIVAYCTLLLLCDLSAQAQQRQCGTQSPEKLRYVSPEMMRNPAMDDPIMVRLFVHICAYTDGSGAVIEDTLMVDILNNIENFYEPHGICFILTGFSQINNTELLYIYDDDEDELYQYLVPGAINIFIHQQLYIDGEPFGGRAWDIPNHFLSLSASGLDYDHDPLVAHELGHCFGLYHTHENTGGSELVNRTGICSNCANAGDLLCDTPADPYIDGDLSEHVTGCVYTGSLTDACDESFEPDPLNFMSYAPGPCWDYFTSGQGIRMRSFLLNDSDLSVCLSPQDVVFSPTTNVIAAYGTEIFSAHHSILVQAINYEIVGSTIGFFGAPSTRVVQNVHFAPSTGSVLITPQNTLCD